MTFEAALSSRKKSQTVVPPERIAASRGLRMISDGADAPLTAPEHDFGRVAVNNPSPISTQSCPLSIASPRACPIGGACHTCPVKIQKKLVVNQPGDEFEQEADRIAEKITKAPEAGSFASAPRLNSTPVLQRKSATREDDDDDVVQAKEFPGQNPGWTPAQDVSPLVHEVIHSPGRTLDAKTRAFMEPRFGRNLGDVRLHTGIKEAESARAVNALAYTAGRDIVFAAGQYAPFTPAGRRLLAHELAHTLQQGAGERLQRVAWTPTHADERTSAGGDRFAARTFELSVPSVTGVSGHISTQTIDVSIFIPSGARPDRNKIHVFFSPGAATETGLLPSEVGMNAVMTHGFRGASEPTEWILIGVPGRVGPPDRHGNVHEDNAFNTIDTAGIQACLRAAGRSSTSIDALRLSSHSRGSRGLRETLTRHLITGPVPERVVIFDAAFSSLDRALAASGIPGSRITALNVTDPGRLTVPVSTNISLPAGAMRAIGYTRIIQDAITTRPGLAIPSAIASRLLPLPPRGQFTSRSPAPAGMTNIQVFARTHAAAIRQIVANEDDPATGFKAFIDSNNLIQLGTVFAAGTYSHHLFVAELAHEAVD